MLLLITKCLFFFYFLECVEIFFDRDGIEATILQRLKSRSVNKSVFDSISLLLR
ncbi:hypothetical protein RND81_06G064400 [Saponaria officinalis]|uniref:Uncharacterized protein n=1 Tax=Saponaria officinalis TaxID=3572 RepID=A0AAW1K8H8_SAPOF